MAEHIEHNNASRAELEAHAARVRDGSVTNTGDWSPSAALAHIAFWDRMLLERWRSTLKYARRYPDPLPDGLEDLINEAALPAWSALSPAEAATEAASAAAAIDEFVATVPADVVAELRVTGKERLVDRSFHRREHTAGFSEQ